MFACLINRRRLSAGHGREQTRYLRCWWYNDGVRAALHIEDIGMAYGGTTLFEGVTVDIRAGQRVIVTGANGTGNTTFLKILAGLVRPVSGKVEVDLCDGRKIDDV